MSYDPNAARDYKGWTQTRAAYLSTTRSPNLKTFANAAGPDCVASISPVSYRSLTVMSTCVSDEWFFVWLQSNLGWRSLGEAGLLTSSETGSALIGTLVAFPASWMTASLKEVTISFAPDSRSRLVASGAPWVRPQSPTTIFRPGKRDFTFTHR